MTFKWLSEETLAGRPMRANPLEYEPADQLAWSLHRSPSIHTGCNDAPVSEAPGFLCYRKWKAIFLSPPMLYLFNLVFSAWRMLKLQESARNILLYLVTVWTQQHRCYSYINRFCGSMLKSKHSPDLVSLFGRASRGNPSGEMPSSLFSDHLNF